MRIVKTTHVSPDERDIRTMKRVAAFSCAAGAILAMMAWFNPPDTTIDPASTPEVRAQVAACVAAKPEIEAAARRHGVLNDWRGILEQRIEAVNAYDPRQCGELLEGMRRSRKEAQDLVIMVAGAAA
jgi:hypothetical protein